MSVWIAGGKPGKLGPATGTSKTVLSGSRHGVSSSSGEEGIKAHREGAQEGGSTSGRVLWEAAEKAAEEGADGSPPIQLHRQFTDSGDSLLAADMGPTGVPACPGGERFRLLLEQPIASDVSLSMLHAVYPKRILVMSPHPDDDVISLGGTLIRLIDQGHEVRCRLQCMLLQVPALLPCAPGHSRVFRRCRRSTSPT